MNKPIGNIEKMYNDFIEKLANMSDAEYKEYVDKSLKDFENGAGLNNERDFIIKDLSMINEDRLIAIQNHKLKNTGVKLVKVIEEENGVQVLKLKMEKI